MLLIHYYITRNVNELETNFGSIKIFGEKITSVSYLSGDVYINGVEYLENNLIQILKVREKQDSFNEIWYFDIEDLLSGLDVKYTYNDGIIDIDSSSLDDSIFQGIPYHIGMKESIQNLLPLDLSIAVDGKVMVTPNNAVVAYEYRGKVIVDTELINQSIGRNLFIYR